MKPPNFGVGDCIRYNAGKRGYDWGFTNGDEFICAALVEPEDHAKLPPRHDGQPHKHNDWSWWKVAVTNPRVPDYSPNTLPAVWFEKASDSPPRIPPERREPRPKRVTKSNPASPAKIDTAACKRAIVDWVKAHPGHVSTQFIPPVDEAPAADPRNWKRESKERVDGTQEFARSDHTRSAVWLRQFVCGAYGDGDELRAYVWADDENILRVEVHGE